MKELQIKPLHMGHKDKPIIFWDKEQELFSIIEFNEIIEKFFDDNKNYEEFHLQCEIGADDTMMSYVLDFSRNKTETVQDALFNNAFEQLQDALKYLEEIKITMGISALLNN